MNLRERHEPGGAGRDYPDAARRRARSAALALIATAGLIAFAAPARADITLTQAPDGLVEMTEEVTVGWEESVYCNLKYGRVPGVHTDETAAEGWGPLVFTPLSEGMSHGVYYCVVDEVGGPQVSEEFVLIVDSPVFPSPTAPSNGSTVYGTTTTLQWDPVDGVPYYHVLLSDHDISVTEENGELVVTGANLIWQAITSGTSIQYGSVDPSGFFTDSNGTSPPLMTGFDYRWLVFNNYGNNPLLTSTSGLGLSAFSADVPVSMEPPVLVAPVDSLLVTDEYMTFDWEPVDGASGYHVYLYENREWLEAEASFPVWDGATPSTSVEVHVGAFLVSGRYSWRVVALDSSGRGGASETRAFEYATETGTARIRTKKLDGSQLPNVLVEMEFLAGGVNVLPTFTDAAGARNVDLLPGEYEFHASKPDYVDTTATAVIPAGGDPYVIIYMRKAPARMRGVVQDEAGGPVFDADVVAVSGQYVLETVSDLSGNFVLQAKAGTWQVHAEKPGYAPSQTVGIELRANDYLELPEPLTLVGTPGTASGNVVNSGGSPVVGATVTAESDFGLAATMTNSSGHYQLELAPGEWTLSAAKSGFHDSGTRTVTVSPQANTSVEPPLVLTPASSAVMGRVTDGAADCAGAVVTAVPRSGACIGTMTNGYGEFLMFLSPGVYDLVAEHAGHAPSLPHQVTVGDGRSYVGIELTVLPATLTLSGIVTDGVDPVAGAVVTNGEGSALTDGQGEFSLEVRQGVHELRARAEGYVAGAPLLVAAHPSQSPQGLEIQLAGGASSISGTVEFEGVPVARAVVTASTSGGAEMATADDAGEYTLSVEAGEWSVSAAKPGFVSTPEVVYVAPGHNVSGVDIELVDDSALVEGSVTDSRAGVHRALVLLYEEGADLPSFTTFSDSDGDYSVVVAPGPGYRVVVSAPEHGSWEGTTGPLTSGAAVNVDAGLPYCGALIAGTVTGAGGALEGAVVEADGTWSAATGALGGYKLWVTPGLHDITVSHPGHGEATLTDVAAASGQTTPLDVDLFPVHASLAGGVTDSATSEPVEAALITAIWSGAAGGARGGMSAMTDAGGAYSLPEVVPGEMAVSVRRTGFAERDLAVTLAEHESGELDVGLTRLLGSVAGRVTDGGGGTPLSGVAVRAKRDGNVAAVSMTGADGTYVLTGLTVGEAYDVFASRSGYTPESTNPVGNVVPDAVDVDFTLRECAGVISGTVVDEGDGQPLPGASVTADNGLGHFGIATSDEDGAFAITGLAEVGAYEVTASLYGYFDGVAHGVEAGTEPFTLGMPRNFAHLSGSLTPDGDGVELSLTSVVATNIAYAGHSRTAQPDELGGYEIPELRPGTYVISVSGGAHLCTPPQTTLAVGEGQELSGIDFTVEKALVERVDVVGPGEVQAGNSVVYSGVVFAQDERLVDAELDWWVAPECAGSVARATGELAVAEGYVGEVTVSAREPGSGQTGHASAAVYVTVTPQYGATLTDSTGMVLDVLPGAVSESKSLYLTHEQLPDVMRYSEGYVVQPQSYHLKPCGLVFDAAHRPTLSLPRGGADELVRWSHELLTWEPVDCELQGDAMEAEISELAQYAARGRSGSLAVSDVTAEPDPFSPENGPVTISYELDSDAARMPFVTVRIYNMAAHLVRELVTNEPQGKGRQDVQWDGLTDSDEKARNGRYVVEVLAEDTTGTETALGTVVLVK